jgi:hypothetical protein
MSTRQEASRTAAPAELTSQVQLIHYSDDTYETGDDLAHAVVEYAKALALVDSSATIDIPFRREDATIGQLELLIGPASQIVLESSPTTAGAELRDDALVASIAHKTLLLRTDHHTALDVDDQADAAMPIAISDEL